MKSATKPQRCVTRDTKKNILEIAQNLFSEYSYSSVSMNDIAKKLKITKAALYYHFVSKEEIYIGVLDKAYNDLNASIQVALSEKTVERRLRVLIENYLDFGANEKSLIKSTMLKIASDNFKIQKHIVKLKEQRINLISPVIEEMVANKKLSSQANDKLLTSLLIGMMDGLILEYSFLNNDINSSKVADQIVVILRLNN